MGMTNDNLDILLSLEDVAARLGGVTARIVEGLVERGELTIVRVGPRRRMIPESAVHRFLASGGTPPIRRRGRPTKPRP